MVIPIDFPAWRSKLSDFFRSSQLNAYFEAIFDSTHPESQTKLLYAIHYRFAAASKWESTSFSAMSRTISPKASHRDPPLRRRAARLTLRTFMTPVEIAKLLRSIRLTVPLASSVAALDFCPSSSNSTNTCDPTGGAFSVSMRTPRAERFRIVPSANRSLPVSSGHRMRALPRTSCRRYRRRSI